MQVGWEAFAGRSSLAPGVLFKGPPPIRRTQGWVQQGQQGGEVEAISGISFWAAPLMRPSPLLAEGDTQPCNGQLLQ